MAVMETKQKSVREMSIGELAAEFERLVKEKKAATVRETERNLTIDEIENRLLELMGEQGCQNWKTVGGMTLYRRTDKFPSVAEGFTKEQLVEGLANYEGTMDLVSPNYNSNSLRARLREIEENGEVLPEELARMIRIVEKDRIGHK